MSTTESDRRFTALFERHHHEVLAYCTRRIPRTEADDATAEVLAVAWRRIAEVDWETVGPPVAIPGTPQPPHQVGLRPRRLTKRIARRGGDPS